jgi:oxygen-independent coproporphyrinogen-3 oxidase
MGAQSFDPAELAMLGRVHGEARPEHAFALARAHGFTRLSLDLMFGYPGHDAAVFGHSIERALALEPEHVSAYCFIPEAGTPLGDAVRSGVRSLPPPERQAELYDQLDAALSAAGLACYETSNFCRPGAEARHNLVYWLRRPYLGCGPSAHSLLAGRRLGNHYALARWAQALERGEDPAAEVEGEDTGARARETVMLGLRLSSGLDAADHEPEAWHALFARYAPAFAHAVATGRLERRGDAWRIPRALRFVADDVIAWIDARADAGPVDTSLSASVTSSACHSPHSRVA